MFINIGPLSKPLIGLWNLSLKLNLLTNTALMLHLLSVSSSKRPTESFINFIAFKMHSAYCIIYDRQRMAYSSNVFYSKTGCF